MLTHSAYEELKGWQAGLGAVLGFVALMIGALWNFHLNRRRDARLREEEMRSVAVALYGEIVLLRQEIARLARAVANVHAAIGTERDPIITFDHHFVEEHNLSEPMLYKALAPKLGLLPSDLVLDVTTFHKNIQETRAWLPRLISDPDRRHGYSVAYVLVPARDAVLRIVPALRKIERMAGIVNRAPDLDLGKAESAIEIESETSGDSIGEGLLL